jgi:hypothetical protein
MTYMKTIGAGQSKGEDNFVVVVAVVVFYCLTMNIRKCLQLVVLMYIHVYVCIMEDRHASLTMHVVKC